MSKSNKKTSDVIVEGKFSANAKGYGFVTVEGMERDLFIPMTKVGTAMSGDTVKVRMIPMRDGTIDMTGKGDGDHRQEAEVVEIVERGVTEIVGTYQKASGEGYVIPDNKKLAKSIRVKKKDSMKAVNGHKVVCKITDYGADFRGPEGKITEILGHMDDPGVDILSIIKAYNLPEAFPEAVQAQVKKIPDHVEYQGQGREDWRDKLIVTIDGPSTKDIDDAISIERDGEDYILGVHIADVSQYVFEDTALDKEALKRATSVYLVDRVIPMLPHELSNGICSLNQGEDRYALSCIMTIDKKGNVKASRVVETVIRSSAKLSYPGVMKVFEGDASECMHALEMQGMTRGLKTHTDEMVRMLKRGLRLSKILGKKRSAEGSINFEFSESEILLDENGKPIDIVPHDRNDATEMIEQFMILANETVSKTFCLKEIPFVYRSHGVPSDEKITNLSRFIRNFGYRIKQEKEGDLEPIAIQNLLSHLKGKPEESMIQIMVLRSMQRAEYTTECAGHFGLALKYYSHFTSPIRRYPDLQIHRIIKEYLHGKLDDKRRAHYEAILPGVCKQSSENERRADDAERDTDKQKKAEYMAERIGETYDGAVSGVTGWGLYVELPNTVEGLIPISTLRDDYYNYDEDHGMLYGERTGKSYSLGQKVTVQVAAVDTVARTIDFELIDSKMQKKQAARRLGKKSKGKNGKTVVTLTAKEIQMIEDEEKTVQKKPKKLNNDGSPYVKKAKKLMKGKGFRATNHHSGKPKKNRKHGK